jgi:eukaryotic-like serine/threonine-protein kinase
MTKDSKPGRLLGNRYRLLELVGKGAMGRVYKAEDILLGGVIVAVKFLSQTLLNQNMKERFEREATICALLGEKCMQIVRVRDYGVDVEEIPYYVMEFLEGESLSDRIKYEPLKLDAFVSITRQICIAMDAAHKGIIFKGELCAIIHRDIKPSNIIIIQDPSLGELIKVLDFGIAKLVQTSQAQTQTFMGTLAYCSPEQMEGKELDNRSDIYSLGIMMYEMLTSQMPLFPENPNFGGWYKAHHFTPPDSFPGHLQIPQKLKDLVMGCMAKKPADRPQNVGEILSSLNQFEGTSTGAFSFSSFQKIHNPPPAKALPDDTKRHDYGEYNDYDEDDEDDDDDSDQDTIIVDPKLINKTSEQIRITVPPAFSINEMLMGSSWPDDKPQKKIVFPRLVQIKEETFATLWVMLEQTDIIKRLSSTRYNQFLFLSIPHPMILWITVLYNHTEGARWLPCYLDLKTTAGQKVTQYLSKVGMYRLLFFAINNPQFCQNIMNSTIASNQCQMLKDWLQSSHALRSGNAQMSKQILQQEFQKLKPKILLKLENLYTTDAPTDISG